MITLYRGKQNGWRNDRFSFSVLVIFMHFSSFTLILHGPLVHLLYIILFPTTNTIFSQKDGLSHYTADGGKLLLENTANKGVGTQRKQAEHYDGVADTTNRLIIEMEPIFDSECADDNDRNGCDKKVARHQEPAPLQPIFDLDLSDASPAAVAGNTIGGEMESVLTQKEDKRSLVVCDRPEESHQLLSFAVGRKWISNKLRKV